MGFSTLSLLLPSPASMSELREAKSENTERFLGGHPGLKTGEHRVVQSQFDGKVILILHPFLQNPGRQQFCRVYCGQYGMVWTEENKLLRSGRTECKFVEFSEVQKWYQKATKVSSGPE